MAFLLELNYGKLTAINPQEKYVGLTLKALSKIFIMQVCSVVAAVTQS